MNQIGGSEPRHHRGLGRIPPHGTDRKYRERDDEISGTALIDIITLITRFRHIMATLSRAGDPRRVMSVITRGMLNLLVNRRRAGQSSDKQRAPTRFHRRKIDPVSR